MPGGDGRGLAGGFGLLIDAAGDDQYDRRFYAAGGAAHAGVAVMTDRSGDDRYDVGIGTSSSFGHARDGSVAWFVDGAGDDRYRIGRLSAGGASLNAIAVFLDRRGDDVYESREPACAAPIQLGWAWRDRETFGDFRDATPEVGVFLDTGGDDRYVWSPPPSEEPIGEQVRARGPPQRGGNDREWTHFNDGSRRGFGLDNDACGAARPR